MFEGTLGIDKKMLLIWLSSFCKSMDKFLKIAFLLLLANVMRAQQHETYGENNFQYGFSFKGKLEIGAKKGSPLIKFRFSANAGIGSEWIYEGLYPTFNTELEFYNGGLGSRKGKNNRTVWSFDVICALTMTAGIRNHFQQKYTGLLQHRNVPLYYFADFVNPALQNPYSNSLSLGTNLIFASGRETQRVGFLNLHPYEPIQLSYYNDGTPFGIMGLGDGKDRYYTGGGVLSYHLPLYTAVNQFEASYHKFTGFTLNAFELSNEMNLSYVYYDDMTQSDYNKSRWSIGVANVDKGFGLNVTDYNTVNWDGQHLIHWIIFNAFHLVSESPYRSIEPSYFYKTSNILIN